MHVSTHPHIKDPVARAMVEHLGYVIGRLKIAQFELEHDEMEAGRVQIDRAYDALQTVAHTEEVEV